jgi:nucleoside-diphosphate-sugar epimerase
MTQNAFVIGATGQIGRAAVRALAEDGWRVRAASRSGGTVEGWPPGVEPVAVDRADGAALAAAIGEGADVLVDTVAYGREHARQLIGLADRVGSAVVVSTAAVYRDDEGRAFGDEPFPRFPVPLPEDQPTIPPGDEGYAPRKVALEEELLAAADRLPATLLRAGAVHGPGCRSPREWYFVKRVLDGRPVRVLGHGGASRFHPVATANLAELIRLAARRPGARVLNAGDPQAPTVAEISAAVDAVMGASSETVTVDGPPPAPNVGETPWSVEHPVVLDMERAARELGYRAVTGYADSLPATVAWLVDAAAGRDWREAFPGLAAYPPDFAFFDYEAEDRWLASRG